jgi:small subunit ribosomal protein S1
VAPAELEQAYAQGLPVRGNVTAVVKGGVEVQVAGVRGFCPISQIDSRFVEDAAVYVGQRHAFRITRYEGGKRINLVLSRRAVLEAEARELAAATRKQLAIGAVLPGVVSSIKDYGAFVDLGGLEGMVHISEMGFARVAHPTDVLSVGQAIDVQVLKIEETGDARRPEKIALSIRSLQPDPFVEIERSFPEGTRTRGTVVRVEQFGAFVELVPGVEGLVHISELGAGRRVQHAREAVKVGEEVEVKVLRVERDKRRIALAMGSGAEGDAAEVAAAMREYAGTGQGLGTLGDLLKKSLEKK